MTRKLLTIVVLAIGALVLEVAPALALSTPPEVTSPTSAQRGSAEPIDFWNYESGRKVADSSPGVSPEGLANQYGQVDFWNYESGRKVADSSPGVAPDGLATLYTQDTGAQVAVSTSERGIEWPQRGIGLGLGVVLVFGLGLAMRLAHVRPFAH